MGSCFECEEELTDGYCSECVGKMNKEILVLREKLFSKICSVDALRKHLSDKYGLGLRDILAIEGKPNTEVTGR